jgi:hypothetical protein
MRSSEKGKPDLFDKQLSGTANFRVRDLTLDPRSKVSEKTFQVDLLVLAQLEVVQSEGGAKLKAFHSSFSARVYRRLKAASCLIAIDVSA